MFFKHSLEIVVLQTLIESDGINAITFTGSVPVGAKVAQRAVKEDSHIYHKNSVDMVHQFYLLS